MTQIKATIAPPSCSCGGRITRPDAVTCRACFAAVQRATAKARRNASADRHVGRQGWAAAPKGGTIFASECAGRHTAGGACWTCQPSQDALARRQATLNEALEYRRRAGALPVDATGIPAHAWGLSAHLAAWRGRKGAKTRAMALIDVVVWELDHQLIEHGMTAGAWGELFPGAAAQIPRIPPNIWRSTRAKGYLGNPAEVGPPMVFGWATMRPISRIRGKEYGR